MRGIIRERKRVEKERYSGHFRDLWRKGSHKRKPIKSTATNFQADDGGPIPLTRSIT
jgi:hypothetical protein